MVSKKAIIGIVSVVIVVAVIEIAVGGGSGEDKPDIRYDYEMYMTDEIEGSVLLGPADEGMTYVVMDFILANDSDSEISTNSLMAIWKLELDGVTYTSLAFDTEAPGYQLIGITPGNTGTSATIFEVPEGHSLDEFNVLFEYTWNFDVDTWEHDDTLM